MFISVDLPAPFSPSSACTSPRRTSRDTSSLATTPGNSLRIPRISRTSSSLTEVDAIARRREGEIGSPSRRARQCLLADRRRRLELAGDDLRLVLVHGVDPRLRHRRAALADPDTVVLPVQEDVRPTREVPLERILDRVLDTDIRLLESAREDVLRDAVLVGVDADPPLAERRCLLQRAVTAEAGDLEDHLGPLPDQVLRHVRARRRVGEAVRVLNDRLRARNGLVGAVLVPGDVRVDGRDLDAAHRADRAGLAVVHLLGLLGRENADETAGLRRLT